MPTITLQVSDDMLATLAKLIASQLNKADRQATYTVTEASRALRCAEKTIRRRVEAGTLPRVPGSGRVLIPAAAIEQMLNP